MGKFRVWSGEGSNLWCIIDAEHDRRAAVEAVKLWQWSPIYGTVVTVSADGDPLNGTNIRVTLEWPEESVWRWRAEYTDG